MNERKNERTKEWINECLMIIRDWNTFNERIKQREGCPKHSACLKLAQRWREEDWTPVKERFYLQLPFYVLVWKTLISYYPIPTACFIQYLKPGSRVILGRGVEITRWLQQNESLVEMPRWLALDDLDLAKDGGRSRSLLSEDVEDVGQRGACFCLMKTLISLCLRHIFL